MSGITSLHDNEWFGIVIGLIEGPLALVKLAVHESDRDPEEEDDSPTSRRLNLKLPNVGSRKNGFALLAHLAFDCLNSNVFARATAWLR